MKKQTTNSPKSWVLVRMPKTLRTEIEKRAAKEGRSLSNQVLQIIKRDLEKRDAKKVNAHD